MRHFESICELAWMVFIFLWLRDIDRRTRVLERDAREQGRDEGHGGAP